MNSSIEIILDKLSNSTIDGDQVSEILNNPKDFPSELIDKIALETAIKYWNGKITYQVGDYIMNHVYGFWLWNECYFKNFIFPKTAQECYDAFDSGEFNHTGDSSEIDPVEKYTKPQIEKLLRKRNQIT